jgi:hypothetical protein
MKTKTEISWKRKREKKKSFLEHYIAAGNRVEVLASLSSRKAVNRRRHKSLKFLYKVLNLHNFMRIIRELCVTSGLCCAANIYNSRIKKKNCLLGTFMHKQPPPLAPPSIQLWAIIYATLFFMHAKSSRCALALIIINFIIYRIIQRAREREKRTYIICIYVYKYNISYFFFLNMYKWIRKTKNKTHRTKHQQ